MPPEELSVFNKLSRTGDSTIEDVTQGVFQGIRTSANKIYIVNVLDADRVEAQETDGTVTISPIGDENEFEIEKELLRPFLQGDEIGRWRGEWSGRHVVHPYRVNRDENGEIVDAELYSQNHLENNLPMTWEFFQHYRDDLEGREGGRMEDEDDWYGYIYPKNLELYENPKIIQSEICSRATYMLDEIGTWYFTTGYGALLEPGYRNKTDEIVCQLNSKPLDFYFKHIAAIKAGGYYSYRTQYVEQLPCITNGNGDVEKELRETISEITDLLDTDSRTDRFPEAYLEQHDGDLGYIDYEWQTRRYPVNADIQELADGRFAVTAGRSDEITDPLIDNGDREEQKLRAEYVYAAVDGRSMKSGEVQTIPIPQSRGGVEQVVESLHEDQRKVEETDIADLEADIDEAVYDLFNLTEDDREVVEEYLEVF